jgi:hypothetical protein
MTTPDETPATEPAAEAAAVDVPSPPPSAEPVAPPSYADAPAAYAPAAYAPAPQGYAAPPAGYAQAPNPMPNTWMNIVAFVTGILGLAIVPVIFGHLGVSQSNKGRADFKWMGIVGLVLGYLTIAVYIFLIVAWSALFAGAAISNG